MKLTPNFSLTEFEFSQTATRLGIDNRLPIALRPNVERLAETLEQIRARLGKPIRITSGYRSPALNIAIPGSSPTSAHTKGLAVDFVCPAYGTPLDICKALRDRTDIDFDQLIEEGTWVHLAIPAAGRAARREILTASFAGGKVAYAKGLRA
jgi:hypothetical protein